MSRVVPIVLLEDDQSDAGAGLPCCYVVARNGGFLRRETEFFTSCVPAVGWPDELGAGRSFFEARFPKIPAATFARIVGFFTRVADLHGCEAGVWLAWDRQARAVELIVPQQVGTVARSSGGRVHPIGLEYELPGELPARLVVFGDVHCHVDGSAFASGIDVRDEEHRPGLHLVVGRIHEDPVELHADAVVDGQRFTLQPETLIDGAIGRDLDVPEEWLQRVRPEAVHERRPASRGGWK